MRRCVLAATMCLALPALAAAQMPAQPIGFFAVDARGVMASYGPTTEQAATIGYAEAELPSRGWGWDVGVHVYPLRWRAVTLGIGGNVLMSSGHSEPVDGRGEPTGREADTRFRSVASQVSLNFGNREGWSYLSGGLGYSTFAITNAAYPEPGTLPRRATINFGGGARWAVRGRVAFALDLRFYRVAALGAGNTVPADPLTTRFVLGAGLAFK